MALFQKFLSLFNFYNEYWNYSLCRIVATGTQIKIVIKIIMALNNKKDNSIHLNWIPKIYTFPYTLSSLINT